MRNRGRSRRLFCAGSHARHSSALESVGLVGSGFFIAILIFLLTGCGVPAVAPAPALEEGPPQTSDSRQSPAPSARTAEETTGTTPAPSVLKAPTGLRAELENPELREYKAVNLSWSDVPGASRYRVYVSETQDGHYRMILETTVASCRVTDRVPATAYFAVTAVNNAGESGHSARLKVNTGLIREGIVFGPSGERTEDFGDQVFRSLAVSPADANLVFVGSEGNGIFKSSDGGDTWTWQRRGLLYMAGDTMHPAEYAETYDMVVDPVNPSHVYAAFATSPGPAEGDYPSSYGGFYYTHDGGSTWQRSVKGLPNGSAGAIAIDPDDPSILFLGLCGGLSSFTGYGVSGKNFEGGIFKSTDGGRSWTRLNLPDSQVAVWSDFWRIVAWDSKSIFALGQKDEDPSSARSLGLIKSEDAGETWREISPPGVYLSSFDVARGDRSLVYGVSYYGMYREDMRTRSTVYCSTDGGLSWQPVKDYQMYGPVRVSPHDSQTVFIANRKVLYKSTDRLAAIKKVLETDADITDIEFAYSDSRLVYVGAAGLRVYKSLDGGDTFSLKADLREFINAQE